MTILLEPNNLMSMDQGIYPIRTGKPRPSGLTVVLDTFTGLNREEFEIVASFVDIAKIGWALPLLVDKSVLTQRVRFYHNMDVKVSTGGTLTEISFIKGKVAVQKMMELVRAAGFDIIEISEGNIDLSLEQKQELVDLANKYGLDYLIEVGKKDLRRQLTLQHTVEKIREAFQLGSKKVVVEGGENGRAVSIYDQNGQINWEWVNLLAGTFGPPNLIFEAPQDQQQISFILEFGPNVNLANIRLDAISRLESQRRGLRGETLGLARHTRPLKGSPAVRFIYHLIGAHNSINQSELVERSGLPRRTVQAALSFLEREGFVQEVVDLADSRRRKYNVAT